MTTIRENPSPGPKRPDLERYHTKPSAQDRLGRAGPSAEPSAEPSSAASDQPLDHEYEFPAEVLPQRRSRFEHAMQAHRAPASNQLSRHHLAPPAYEELYPEGPPSFKCFPGQFQLHHLMKIYQVLQYIDQ